jgi:hypothetical protein
VKAFDLKKINCKSVYKQHQEQWRHQTAPFDFDFWAHSINPVQCVLNTMTTQKKKKKTSAIQHLYSSSRIAARRWVLRVLFVCSI